MASDHIPDIATRHMQAVLAVAEYRSFVAAAAALRTSQPALTRSIKRVEDVLGVQLFERSTRSVTVTEAGREFIAVAERVTNDLRLTVESLRELADQKRGQVIVSSIVSLANGVLPEAVTAYRRERPGIEVQVRDGVHGSVLDHVRSGAADFGLNYLVDVPDIFETEVLGEGRFDLIAAAVHPLAQGRRRSVRFDNLAGVSMVSLPQEAQTRKILDTTAAMRGVRLRHDMVVSQIPTLISFVRAGAGVGLIPSAALDGNALDGLIRLEVTEPEIALDIGVVRLKERRLSPAAEGLLATIRDMADAINN